MIELKKVRILPNNSTEYFLPVISEIIGLEFIPNIKHAYFWDNEVDKNFCVLYKFSGKKDFLEFEGRIMDGEHYIGHEDCAEYTLYKFKVPEDMQWLIDMIKNRKVDMLDSVSKQKILQFNLKRGKNIQFIRDVLHGKFRCDITYDKDETFSEHVIQSEILDANDIYKKKEDNNEEY